jgi:hypothetical protein
MHTMQRGSSCTTLPLRSCLVKQGSFITHLMVNPMVNHPQLRFILCISVYSIFSYLLRHNKPNCSSNYGLRTFLHFAIYNIGWWYVMVYCIGFATAYLGVWVAWQRMVFEWSPPVLPLGLQRHPEKHCAGGARGSDTFHNDVTARACQRWLP